jgi:SAM-dependent methyltransferase
LAQLYDNFFYDDIRDGARRSANEVVPLVVGLLAPRSVVDVGCGTGDWLKCFMDRGVEDVLGIDGEWAEPDHLLKSQFIRADLSRPFAVGRTFDLALSLEVAEHLPDASAEGFVASLTKLAPMILFSAAIPYQRGTNHLNEQWPEYWASRFLDQNFAAIDCIRPLVWHNSAVAWWYAQNTILYVDREHLVANTVLGSAALKTDPTRLSLVHPESYLGKARDQDLIYLRPDPHRFSFSTLSAIAPTVFMNALRRKLRWR